MNMQRFLSTVKKYFQQSLSLSQALANNYSLSIMLTLFLLLCLLAFIIIVIITGRNAAGGEVFLLVPLRNNLIGYLIATRLFQLLAKTLWGSLLLGSSSETLLTLIVLLLLALTFLVVYAFFIKSLRQPLSCLILLSFWQFFKILVLCSGMDLAFVCGAPGWGLFPWWGIGLHKNTGPGFAGLQSPELLRVFADACYQAWLATLKDNGLWPREPLLLGPLHRALEAQVFYSRTDVEIFIGNYFGNNLEVVPIGLWTELTANPFVLGAGWAFFGVLVIVNPLCFLLLDPWYERLHGDSSGAAVAFFRLRAEFKYDYQEAIARALEGYYQTSWILAFMPFVEFIVFWALCIQIQRCFSAHGANKKEGAGGPLAS